MRGDFQKPFAQEFFKHWVPPRAARDEDPQVIGSERCHNLTLQVHD